MHLFFEEHSKKLKLAYVVELSDDSISFDIGSACFETMQYGRSAEGETGFAALIRLAISDENVNAVVVSFNSNCVFDRELPFRIRSAISSVSRGAQWAVLASRGLGVRGEAYSGVYASNSPSLPKGTIPQPIIDCGLDLFIINASLLRSSLEEYFTLTTDMRSFPHWCILKGYVNRRVSVFHPELAIGISGSEVDVDITARATILWTTFCKHLIDERLPSLVGDIQLSQSSRTNNLSHTERRGGHWLADLVEEATAPLSTPMSLSIVIRTKFNRPHLLRRLLTSIVRARTDRCQTEVILSTDINRDIGKKELEALSTEFTQLDLSMTINDNQLSSRVRNLIGGINSAKNDYCTIIDDDDYLEPLALKSLSSVQFLGNKPIIITTSRVCVEEWVEDAWGRQILQSSVQKQEYFSKNWSRMFGGVNQLPVCALIAPTSWLKARLSAFNLRHDLSEDYALFLLLFCAPDVPPILTSKDVFCNISVRTDNSNSVTLTDRRPWVRDITLFIHDLFMARKLPGANVLQVFAEALEVGRAEISSSDRSTAISVQARHLEEIAVLKAEIALLRTTLAEQMRRSIS